MVLPEDLLTDEEIEKELANWEKYAKDSKRSEDDNYLFKFDGGPKRLRLIKTLIHYRDLYKEKMNE